MHAVGEERAYEMGELSKNVKDAVKPFHVLSVHRPLYAWLSNILKPVVTVWWGNNCGEQSYFQCLDIRCAVTVLGRLILRQKSPTTL